MKYFKGLNCKHTHQSLEIYDGVRFYRCDKCLSLRQARMEYGELPEEYKTRKAYEYIQNFTNLPVEVQHQRHEAFREALIDGDMQAIMELSGSK